MTVAHTAAVPPADIRVDGAVLFANVANGESLNLVVPVGSYSVDIVPAGASSPVVFGPVTLAVQGGSLNRVYAVGDPAATTMNVAVHVITVPESGSAPPTMVDTGTGGMAVVMQLFARFLNMLARLSRPVGPVGGGFRPPGRPAAAGPGRRAQLSPAAVPGGSRCCA